MLSERAWTLNFAEKVGVAAPRNVEALIEERGLEHDVRAGAHGGVRVGLTVLKAGDPVNVCRWLGDLGNVQAVTGQRCEVGGFVFESSALKHFEFSVVTVGFV